MSIFRSLKNLDDDILYTISDEELKNLQGVLTDMLADLSEECSRHGIEWMLAYGTMLGAVRHEGFIPWDDDVDIFMTRENYEKFRKIFDEKLSDRYILNNPGDTDYLFQFPRIYKKGTYIRSVQSTDTSPCGAAIDIFLLENLPDGKIRRVIHAAECTVLNVIGGLVRTYVCRDTLLRYGRNSKKLTGKVKLRSACSVFFRFRTLEQWLKKADEVNSRYSSVKTSEMVLPFEYNNYFKGISERSLYGTLILKKFGRYEFPVPKQYDTVLKKEYGDSYMQLPPEEKREKHSFVEFDLGI